MSAIYWVSFDNGQLISVSSADTKSMKKADIRIAYKKAVAKAKTKLAKHGVKANVINCRCVG